MVNRQIREITPRTITIISIDINIIIIIMTSRIENTIARQQEKYVFPVFPPTCGSAILSNMIETAVKLTSLLFPHRQRINSGAYYESHQQLRVIAARYIKQANYDAAANILAAGATALLKAGSQQGAAASGGDLAIMLAKEVYGKAGLPAAFDEDGIKRKGPSVFVRARRGG